MALAAVHLDPDTFQVLGVWLSPGSSAYLSSAKSAHAHQLGTELMAQKGRRVSWDEWCRHLASRRVTVAMWIDVPRNDGEEPRHVLARVVAQEAVSRRSSEGETT